MKKFSEMVNETSDEQQIKINNEAKDSILADVMFIKAQMKIVDKETKKGYPSDAYKLNEALKTISEFTNGIEMKTRSISNLAKFK